MEDRTNFAEAFPNAADWRADASSERGLTRPTTGIAGCCARAASGHAAAPPSRVMNWRALSETRPQRRREADCGSWGSRGREGQTETKDTAGFVVIPQR